MTTCPKCNYTKPTNWREQSGGAGTMVLVIICGVIVIAVATYLYRTRNYMSIDDCNRNPANCIDKNTRILKSIRRLESASMPMHGKPRIPCDLVGHFLQKNATGGVTTMEFKDAGTYDGMYQSLGGRHLSPGWGYWAVQGESLVMRYVIGGDRVINITQIQWDAPGKFWLTEESGDKTYFERDDATSKPSSTCAK